jgi:hypothetical protein
MHPVGAELFQKDGRTDDKRDMLILTIIASLNTSIARSDILWCFMHCKCRTVHSFNSV